MLAAAAKAASRLNEAIRDLEAGHETQPGKLLALTRLTLDSSKLEQLDYAAWRDFVLRDAADLLRSGQSLALSHSLPVDEKCALLDQIRQYPARRQFRDSQSLELDRILAYLYDRFPERVRLHVHGTRWKVDPDVLLIESACMLRYAWQDMLTAYCIEYTDYRLMLTPRSVPRLKRLLDRLSEMFPDIIETVTAGRDA